MARSSSARRSAAEPRPTARAAPLRATPKGYAEVYQAPPLERVELIKKGVRAQVVVDIARSMGASKEKLIRTLGLSRATIDRKIKSSGALSSDEAQRVVGMAKLVGLVETMVQQSGEPRGFDAAKWLSRWIDQELPALGGRRPAELLDTAEGQELVADTLRRMQSGAYG